MKGLYCCVLLSLFSLNVWSQSNGDYRSRQTGDWNTSTTWQVFNAAAWHNVEDAGAGAFQGITPTNASGVITLQPGFIVTVPSGFSVAIDQTIADIFSELVVNGTVTISNGTGNDLELYNDGIDYSFLTVNSGGIVILNDLATIIGSDQGNANFNAGSTYRHFYSTTEGSIPVANWAPTSLVEILGYTLSAGSITATVGGNWSQAFGNFTFNSPISSSTRIFDFAGRLTNIQGELIVASTGAGRINLSTTQSPTISVGSDFEIQGTSRVVFNTTGAAVLNVGQDFIFTSTLAAGSNTNSTGTTTINVTRDFLMNAAGGQLTMASGTGAGAGTFNISRNFSLIAGTIIETSGDPGAGNINFVGTTSATYSNSGTISNTINYSIANGKTLNLGTSAMTGTGTFLLNAGGTLGVASPDGLSTGTTAGNIRVSGTRTFQANANIIYNGSVAQNLGNEWSSTGALNGVAVNLEIANTSSTGVTNNIIGSTSLVGSLTLTTGSLNIGNSNTLQIQSNFVRTGGTVGGDATSNLIFSGSGSLSTLVFTTGMESINNLTVSRATELVLGSNATINGNIALSGGNLNFSGRTLTMNGGSITTNGTGLRSTLSTSNLVFGGSSFTGTIPFSGTGNQLNKLTFGTNGGSYTWTSTVVVNDSVKLTLGALTHNAGLTMANNSDFVKGGGTVTGVPLVVSGSDRFNLTYTGAGATGIELPTSDSDALNDLIISSSGTVTLSSAIKVNGDLSLTGGTFDANNNAIEIVDDFIANSTSDLTSTTITFSGPSSEISGSNVLFDHLTVTGTVAVNVGGAGWRINGNLVNNGSLSVTSGTITFGGTTSITGSSICNFRTMRIAGTLNAPTQMNIGVAFIFESGVFNANSGTVNFTGASTTLSNVAGVTFHNILITGGLTSSPTLNLTGNFTDNGTFTRGTGNVRFTGTSTQLIGGTAETNFNDITITNVSGPPAVQVVSNKNLHGVLTLSAGTVFDPDGAAGSVVFTLRSTGDVFSSGVINDAAIAALPAGAVVDGNVSVQRYMALEGANSNRIYRYISSPVRNTAVSQLTDDFKISGTFTGANQAGNQSMFGYNESVITDQNGNGLDINDGYFDFPASDVSETMDNGRGYAIFVYGNESPYTTNGNALWDVRGTINSGEVVFNSFTTLTTSSNPSSDGWNMVGNPYPSTIDWDAASGWTKEGIANAIYMRDNGVSSPVYATYINGEGLNGGSRYIPIGQAFQVRATSTPVNFRATESVKVAGQQATYFREITYDKIRVALASGNLQDEMVIRFTDAATEAFDPEWDAYKFPNYRLNLSSITGTDEKFAINSMPSLTCGKTIKLSMTDVVAGNYSLNFSEFESIPTEMAIQLFDSYTATTVNVREQTSYSFAVTADINSYGDKRFELRFIGREIPDFDFFADDVCESAAAVVNITDSEQGVSYRVMKNGTSLTDWQAGTGAGLNLRLDASQLAAGENTLSIQASVAGCESAYIDKPLELVVVPLTEVEKVNNGTNCGPGRVVLSATGTVDGNYKWYEAETDATAIAGATNGTFMTPELNKTKTYYVSTTNYLGCESARKPVEASIVIVDNVSIAVDAESNILSSSSQSGNQWFFNGVAMPGANGQSIEVTETGLYEVEVTLKGCSTRASQEMIVLGTEGGKSHGILFYPNPVVDVLSIELPDARPAKGEISTSAGQPIGSIDFSDGKAEFNFSGRAAGLYLVKVIQGNTIVHYKIIKK